MTTTLKASTEQIRVYNLRRKREIEEAIAQATEAERERRRAEKARARSQRGISGKDIAPTPERLVKGGISLQPVYNAQGFQEARVYRSKGPVEHYAMDWPHDIYNAFRAFIADAHTSETSGITLNYEGSARGSASKLGGLGNVHDRVRDAFERFHWVRDRLTMGSVAILDWLVLEVRREATGQALSMQDVGHRIFPAIRDKATAKGIAIGRLVGAGEELAALYRKHHVISREPRPQLRTIGASNENLIPARRP
jgi:hypothetical protein